jgi:uncharacterized protein YaiI (UPF0178 family)
MSFRSPVAVRAAPIVLYVDGDACPVKNEVYRVAERHGVRVVLVSNAPLAVPRDVQVERVVVPSGPDVADDYIAERVSKGDVVVTADVPLAHRCVTAGARLHALHHRRRARDARSHGFAAFSRRGDARAAALLGARPLRLPVRPGSRFGAPEARRLRDRITGERR